MMKSVNKKLKSKKAQSALEFALLGACLVAALMVMTKYIGQSVMGKMRQSSDEIGKQYEPGMTKGKERLWVKGTIETEVKTLNEIELTNLGEKGAYPYDLDESGGQEDDVFGITVENRLINVENTLTSDKQIQR